MTGEGVASAESPRERRYGWAVVAALFLAILPVQGLALGGIMIFDDRLLNALDVSRAAFKFRDLVYILATSFSCLVMAALCEKMGVRNVVLLGLAVLTAVMLGYHWVDNLPALYFLQAMMGFSYACIHVVVLMVVLTRWFPGEDPRRGIALGLCVAGASGGAVLMSQLVAWLMAQMAWRDVFLWLAVLPLLVAPVVFLVVRTPRDEMAGDWRVSRKGLFGFSTELFFRPIAGMLMLALVPVFYVSSCVVSHTVLMLTDQGLGTATAAGGMSAIFIAGVIGKVGSGFLLLRIRLRHAWLALASCMLAGSVLLWLWPETSYIAGLSLVGLGWGGCFPLAQLKIAEAYPGPALAQVLGLFVVFESLGAAGGIWLTALIYDVTGGYSVPFAINTVLLIGGLVAAVAADRMQARSKSSAALSTSEGVPA